MDDSNSNSQKLALLRHGPPRLVFASCKHALSVNRTRKIKEKCVCVLVDIFLNRILQK